MSSKICSQIRISDYSNEKNIFELFYFYQQSIKHNWRLQNNTNYILIKELFKLDILIMNCPMSTWPREVCPGYPRV